MSFSVHRAGGIQKKNGICLLSYNDQISLSRPNSFDGRKFNSLLSKHNQFRASLFKVSRFPSVFVPKMAPKWYTHSMEYYSAAKRSELAAHKTTQVNLKCVQLRGSSKTLKATSCVIPPR